MVVSSSGPFERGRNLERKKIGAALFRIGGK
jgi:hypothetical protein